MKDVNASPPLPPGLDKPNILVILVDEQRYPPVYESAEIREWRKHHFAAERFLRSHGLEFHHHYIGSAACCPSRATLLTGHYPSLHGVSQTNGIAKRSGDPDMFWLDRNTVPTLGHYFREAGYQTYYKGKWHISDEDMPVPGTHRSVPSYEPVTGRPDPGLERLYADADRLDAYGFAGWIGPEPHGRNPRNSGSSAAIGVSGRDETYAEETAELIEALDRQHLADREAQPWLIVASFVNPHDIVLYGALTAHLPAFRFAVGPMPEVPPAPTFDEPLHTKPQCQASYRDLYPYAFQPILDEPFYRKLYYQLQKNADQQIARMLEALTRSSFYDSTIVVFTSDHGELLGAHGGLRQKWYCAYEEILHVPFIIHNRRLFPQPQQCHALTSHVDLMPTLLGLANADAEAIRERLRSKFSEARPLVGRDLSAVIREPDRVSLPDEPICFMSDDDVTRGLHQCNALGMPYPSVAQPNHVETIIMTVTHNSKKQRWKLSRYFDPTQFWSCPGVSDTASSPVGPAYGPVRCWNVSVKTKPAEDEFELYNLSDDPLETVNLAHPSCATPTTIAIQRHMMALLDAQRKHKRLQPATYHT